METLTDKRKIRNPRLEFYTVGLEKACFDRLSFYSESYKVSKSKIVDMLLQESEGQIEKLLKKYKLGKLFDK